MQTQTNRPSLSIDVNTCSRVEEHDDPEYIAFVADVTVKIDDDSWSGTVIKYPDSLWLTRPIQLAAEQAEPETFSLQLRGAIARAALVIEASS